MHSPIIYQDEQRIKQVIFNLQSNALKFTERGRVEIRVKITQDNFLEFKIIDSGIGIKREDQDKLF
jgi:two-component system, OmpR family, aerobic respiration control sensor histidine kinase ArcB